MAAAAAEVPTPPDLGTVAQVTTEGEKVSKPRRAGRSAALQLAGLSKVIP